MLGIVGVAGRLLWANPGRLIVLVAGAVSVALATSGMLLAASTSVAIVRQTVDAGWRGSYDLLVRPTDAPSLSIGGRDVVPLDYLGLRTSGITREQWQRIAGLANVEVAAPVAALGWLKNSSSSVEIAIPNVEPGVVYRVELEAEIAGQDALYGNGLCAVIPGRDSLRLGIRDGPLVDGSTAYVTLLLGVLPATWALVVGVDPAAEDALIGLSGYVDGQYLTSGTYQTSDPAVGTSVVSVPVLTARHSPLPGELRVSVFALDGLTPEQAAAAWAAKEPRSIDEYEAAIEEIVAMGSSRRLRGDSAPLADLLRPLRMDGIALDVDGHLSLIGETGGFLATDNNVVLVPGIAGYRPANGLRDLSLSGRGLWQDAIDPRLDAARPQNWAKPVASFGGDATVYRDLRVTVPPAFMLTPLGTYDREAIEAQFAGAANYAPLGIYDSIPRTMVEDASGRPVKEPLPVSINPAGLNPQPPVGITNLEAVEALRGDHFIDAIRVRVGGITGYSPDAIRRIETVAKQIVDTTGLHVDVIAGSSPVDLRVAVQGVGVMRERWTTLGTAAAIVSGAEGLSALLLGAALGVVLAYLAAFGVFLTGDQATEIGILRRVGWRRRSVVALVATQAVTLGLLAAGLTVGLVAALAAAASQAIDGAALVLAAVAVLAAHPLAAGLAGFAPFGRRRSGRPGPGPRPARSRGGIVGLAMTFAAEAPGRAVVAGVATALALAVAGLVATVEVAAGGELRATLFGSVVAVRLAPYHLLAAAAALFAAGALILDGALLTVERRLSLIGTLRAVGWRSGAIRRLVTLETALPAVIAGLVAAAVVGAVALALNLGWVTLPLALGVLTLAVVLVAVATQLPAGVAVRTSPAATLRAEGASGVVGGLAPRQALLTVAALVVTVSLVAGGWSAAEGAATAPLPFVAPTEHPLSAAAVRIQAGVAALSAFSDRAPGSTSFEQALAYIGDELEAVGYTVQTTAYLSPQPTFLDAQGQPVDPPGVFLPAIAYDAAAWDGQNADLEATLVDATDGALPRTCPVGIAVLRIADYDLVPLAQELQGRCLGRTAAVLAIRTTEEAWTTLSEHVAGVRLPVAHFLTAASPGLAAAPAAPWLVVTVDSRGPGASQSAAPAAVMLEVARQAASEGLAVRIGVVGAKDVSAGSVFLERLAAEPGGPSIWLGPMGGSVAPVLGTHGVVDIDRVAATAGLLWIAPVGASFKGWLARATAPSDQPTSGSLLDVLSRATGIAAGDEANLYGGALTAGLDAAWLGEPAVVTVGPPSIAGTEADTAGQTHPRDLEHLASGLVTALGELDQ